MDVNYLGAVVLLKAALPAMIKAKTRGRIVFVSSVDSLEFPVGCGACSGSKSAIRGLADSSRNELLQYNMSVAVFYPGTSSYNLLDTSKGFETPIICNDATDESANEGNITTGYSTFTDQSLAATKSVDKQAQVLAYQWSVAWPVLDHYHVERLFATHAQQRRRAAQQHLSRVDFPLLCRMLSFLTSKGEGEIVKGTATCWWYCRSRLKTKAKAPSGTP